MAPQQDKLVSEPTIVRVLDFTPTSHRSMDVFLLALATRLRVKGWRTVHVFAGEPASRFRNRLRDLGSPYYVSRFPLTAGSIISLGVRLRRYRPCLLEVGFVSKFSLALPALKWIIGASHLIVCDHGSGSAWERTGVRRLLARLRGAVTGAYIDQIVGVSKFVCRRDTAGVCLPARKMRLIYNGIDVCKYTPDIGARAARRAPIELVYAGQLIPQKGVFTLLRAVRHLARAREDLGPFRLLIAGRGPQSTELERFCLDNGLQDRVEFLGHVDDVASLYRAADVVVVPSEWEEAFGLVAAEAMACGACLVASDAGALPEIVGTDGVAGSVFRRGDALQLAIALADLMGDPLRRRAMGHSARDRVVAQFGLESMVSEYLTLYEDLITRRNGPPAPDSAARGC